MSQRTSRPVLAGVAVTLLSATFAFGQSPVSSVDIGKAAGNTWNITQAFGSGQRKLLVVTVDEPARRQSCRVQSFTLEKLVCSRVLGGVHVYLPQQIAALILPGDEKLSIRLFLGFNVGLGIAIWGTVALAAVCPACAAATAVAALVCFSAAGTAAYADTESDRLLYLAPNQKLKGKLAREFSGSVPLSATR